MASPSPGARFLTLVDVAEVLNTSSAQVYALVRGGDLPAIKIGGRGGLCRLIHRCAGRGDRSPRPCGQLTSQRCPGGGG